MGLGRGDFSGQWGKQAFSRELATWRKVSMTGRNRMGGCLGVSAGKQWSRQRIQSEKRHQSTACSRKSQVFRVAGAQ